MIEFTRINNDVNGNPRYVCHYLNLLTEEEALTPHKYFPKGGISEKYAIAIKRANKIGGRKYHNKSYGGGIVFQSYNVRELEGYINRVVADAQIDQDIEEIINEG